MNDHYHSGMPTFGLRKRAIRIPSSGTGGPVGENKPWLDEFLATENGPAGTQVAVQTAEKHDE